MCVCVCSCVLCLSTEGLQDGSLSRRTRSVVPKDADSGQRLRGLIEQEREEGPRGKLEEDNSTGFSMALSCIPQPAGLSMMKLCSDR